MSKKKCPECPSIPKWMTTFSDLMSLLLTFFVLLLTMATMDPVKIDAAFGILSGGKGIFDSSSSTEDNSILIKKSSQSSEAMRQQMMESIEQYAQGQSLSKKSMSVIKTNQGFTVILQDSILFNSGSSDLLSAAFPILDNVAHTAASSSYYINIEGHTDDVPFGNNPNGNWELSANRALSVLKYFAGAGVPPSKLSSTGYGEYHPITPNITPENRAVNRRVEINFISPEFYESSKKRFDKKI